MLSRRSVLGSLIALPLLSTLAYGRVGVVGVNELEDVLYSARAISEGSGPTLHILVTPGCDKAGSLWDASRSVNNMTLRWIPFSYGSSSARLPVAQCFSSNSIQGVQSLLSGQEMSFAPSAEDFSATDIQDILFDRKIAKLMWQSTGKTPAMPSLAYTFGRHFMVVRGAIPSRLFEEISNLY